MATQILDRQFELLNAQLKALNSLFINKINQENLTHSEILETLRANFITSPDMKPGLDERTVKHDQITRFHLQNEEVLKKHYISISSESFLNKIISEFTIAADQYLENTPEILRLAYPMESFKAINGDPLRIKASYWFETFFIKSGKVLNLTTNFFRRRFQTEGEER